MDGSRERPSQTRKSVQQCAHRMKAFHAALLLATLASTTSLLVASCANSENDSAPPDAAADAGASEDADLVSDTSQPKVDAGTDAALPITTKCKDDLPGRAVVVGVDGAKDEIRFFTHTGGKLIDNNLSFTGLENPSKVAVRADGREAAIAWGGFNVGQYGVVVYSFEKDGTSPTLVKVVTLGSGLLPYAITYVGNDRLLVAYSGGTTHTLVTVDRSASTFVETSRIAGPGNFTYALGGRAKTGTAVLARTELSVDKVSYLHLVAPNDAGAFVSSGTVDQVDPSSIDMRMHPNELFAYSQTGNPVDKPTNFMLNVTGIIHVSQIDATGVSQLQDRTTPREGNRLAIDPQGRFIVLEGNVYTQGIGQTPAVKSHAFNTAPLGADGKLGAFMPESLNLPGLIIDDMLVTPSGHMLVGVSKDATVRALLVMAQISPGDWQVCEEHVLTGSATIAMGAP